MHIDARALVAVAVLGAAGCPGRLEHPERFGVGSRCLDVAASTFAHTCAAAGCHSAQAKMAGLDLESPMIASRLVGVSATGGPGKLVDRDTPSASVLLGKLSPTPPFGARMPPVGSYLDDATFDCMRQWVEAQAAGAGDAGPPGDAGSPSDAGAPPD